METALAIDIGGTKLAVARVDGEGRLTDRRAAPTPARSAAEDVWARLVGLVSGVRRGDEVVVGVGCGGPMAPEGESVSPLNIPAWRGFPLRARLGELTGLPVHVDNDAKALALGEGWVGGGPGRPRRARAAFFRARARALARELETPMAWRYLEVPEAGHEPAAMARAAAGLLEEAVERG